MDRNEVNDYMKGIFDYRAKDYQLNFAHDCMNHKRIVAVFCRQSGKTETTSKLAVMLCRKNKKGDVLVFAPTERQTEMFAIKIRESIGKMPYLTHFHCIRQTQSEFYFNNGRAIRCMTAVLGGKGETIRGVTGGDIIIEEAGSIKDYIITNVILPMGATTDPTIIKIGTPRGKNHFFESSRSPLYKVHQYDYTFPVAAGLISKEYIEEQRAVMSDIGFRTEYGAEFIEDQDAFFSYELIDSCIDPTLKWDMAEYDRLYTYYLGADIARMGQDSTCLTVVRVLNGKAEVCQIVEIKRSDLTYVIERIEEMHTYYHFKRIFIDETGLGAGVTDVLAKKYNPIKLTQGKAIQGFAKQQDFADKVIGIKFTIQSKLDMFSNLKVVMQSGKLKYPNHPKLIAELRDFRYELTENMNVKLHHSEHGHDDFVDALALACKEVNVKKIAFA